MSGLTDAILVKKGKATADIIFKFGDVKFKLMVRKNTPPEVMALALENLAKEMKDV